MKNVFVLCCGIAVTIALLTSMARICAAASDPGGKQLSSAGYSLKFDPANYTVKRFTVDGNTITCRAYENIVYVKYPVDINYQIMNIYVPEEYFEGKPFGAYTSERAPIFLPNSVGGYMPGTPGSPGQDRNGGPNAAFVALSKGFVVAEPGARGRVTRNGIGQYTGKAPACIVDLKAAVRYLRYNDKIMPGDAEKIVSNGTSAGGALSALLGVTGDNKDYAPYLKAIGAADTRDDIFAVSAYCPITNLDNADMAYEWLFNGVNDYTRIMFPGGMPPPGGQFIPPANHGAMPAGPPKMSETKGTMTTDQIKLSGKLKSMFPAYLNRLGLKDSHGAALTMDADGNGTFKNYVKSYVVASAQKALNNGTDLSGLTWITIRNGEVADIDFDKYVKFAGRMKTTPAFDGVDLSNGENDLFGSATIKAQHFTRFGKDNSTVHGSLADSSIVKMMNPMNYISTKGTVTAHYWRIRHGAVDRDTSLAVPIILSTMLQNKRFDVDFAVPWGRGHGGDYDLDELFAWIERICARHPAGSNAR